MKKMMTLVCMLMMLFAFSITANASAASPSGKPITEEGSNVVTSPKTGDNEIMLYGLGTAAVVLASGAVVLRKKAM